MSYLIHGVIILIVLFLIGRKQPEKEIFYLTAGLKILAGIILGLIYYQYYGEGDTIRYWSAASDLASNQLSDWITLLGQREIGHFFNQPRAILFSKVVSGFIKLTQGDYWIVSSYFSLISFGAYWYFYKQICSTLPNLKWPILIAFLLLPSTLFWSSGIMKGALTNPSIVFISTFTLKVFFKKEISLLDFFLAFLSVLPLLFIKYYLLIVFVPVVIYVLFDRWTFKAGIKSQIRGMGYIGIVLLTIFIAPSISPNLDLSRLPEIIHTNQETFQENISIPIRIEPTWSSLLSTTPKALFYGLFGPTVLDKSAVFGIIPKLENLFILVAMLTSFLLLFQQRLLAPDILVVGATLFILTLAVTLPLAAPNYGALIRYRAPFTPFLFTLVTILPTWWIQKKLNH